jgi:hypothetical protein
MSYVESLFSLKGKTAVVIGGTGELCGAMAAMKKKPKRSCWRSKMLAATAILSPRTLPLEPGSKRYWPKYSQSPENATSWSMAQA